MQTSTGVVIGSNYVLLSNAAWSVVARTSQLKETGAVFQLTQWLPTCTDILCSVIHIGTSAEGQIIGSIYRGYRGIIGYLLALKKINKIAVVLLPQYYNYRGWMGNHTVCE